MLLPLCWAVASGSVLQIANNKPVKSRDTTTTSTSANALTWSLVVSISTHTLQTKHTPATARQPSIYVHEMLILFYDGGFESPHEVRCAVLPSIERSTHIPSSRLLYRTSSALSISPHRILVSVQTFVLSVSERARESVYAFICFCFYLPWYCLAIQVTRELKITLVAIIVWNT